MIKCKGSDPQDSNIVDKKKKVKSNKQALDNLLVPVAKCLLG